MNIKWGNVQGLLFVSLSLGFLVWGFVSASGVLTISYFKDVVPKWLIPISAVIGPVFLVIGNMAMGRLSDLIGRRSVFFLTITLYAIGLLGMAVAVYAYNSHAMNPIWSFILFIVLYALAEFGVGGEEPPALSAIAELMPSELRGSMLVLIPNFANVGAALASGIAYVFQIANVGINPIYAMVGAALVIVATAALVRLHIPESVRWLIVKGKVSEARNIAHEKGLQYALEDSMPTIAVNVNPPPLWFRILFLSLIGVVQITTYGLMAYYIIFLNTLPFSQNTALQYFVIFVANLGASAAGLIGFVVDRLSRRLFTLVSYFGGLLTMIPIFAIYSSNNALGSSLTIFYTLLFLNMVFSEFGWAVRTILEPELVPTRVRGTWIGAVRLAAWSIYIALTYLLLNYLNTYMYLLANLLLYATGALISFVWFMRGVETRGLSIAALDRIMA